MRRSGIRLVVAENFQIALHIILFHTFSMRERKIVINITAVAGRISVMSGIHWAQKRGIGFTQTYRIRGYMKDRMPTSPSLPPYWASRASESSCLS